MRYTILTIERGCKSNIKIKDSLAAMHLCMDIFELGKSVNPFTIACANRMFSLSIDDSYPYFVELVDVFTAQMNYNKARHKYGNKCKRTLG